MIGNEKRKNIDYNFCEDLLTSEEKSSKNLYFIFETIKRKLHIKQSRKTQIDSILKKTKCKFFQMIHEIMKYCIKEPVKRLPQNFITNITIDYNKKYLNKTINQIYIEFNIIPDLQILKKKNSIKLDTQELFTKFVSKKLMILYNDYLQSQRYLKDFQEIRNKSGKQIAILFDFVSKNFVDYFLYNNHPSNNNINNINENKLNDDNHSNNINNDDKKNKSNSKDKTNQKNKEE